MVGGVSGFRFGVGLTVKETDPHKHLKSEEVNFVD